MRAKFASLILLLAAVSAAEIPALRQPVTDLGQVLSRSTIESLDQLIRQVHAQGGPQISVLVVKDMAGEPIESYSIKVVEKAQLGSAKQDNGVLLLLALKERKLRIEVGQGLEGVLTDAQSRRIIDWDIVPRLKQGDFDSAMQAGVVGILEHTYPEVLHKVDAPKRKAPRQVSLLMILMFGLMALFLSRLRSHRGFGRLGGMGGIGGAGWGSSSGWGSSGGSWGGGGGGFSGGGASGSW